MENLLHSKKRPYLMMALLIGSFMSILFIYKAYQSHSLPSPPKELAVTLTWQTEDDLDLGVVTLDGILIYHGNRYQPVWQFSQDSNAKCDAATIGSVEEIKQLTDEPPPGMYQVFISYEGQCIDSSEPVPYQLAININGKLHVCQGQIQPKLFQPPTEITFHYPFGHYPPSIQGNICIN